MTVPGDETSTSYFHGGPSGIQPGEILHPKHVSGTAATMYADRAADYREAVYLTTDVEFARSWAATWAARHGRPEAAGAVYRVRPIGEIERDPDFHLGEPVSWMSPRAEVLAVQEEGVSMPASEATRGVAKYMYWPNGDPMYTHDGFLTRGPEDPPQLKLLNRFLGPWRSKDEATLPYELGYLMQAHASGSLAGITPEHVRRFGENALRLQGPVRRAAR